MSELIYATTISGRTNVARTGPIRPAPDSIHVRIYDDDEVIITTTGKIDPSSPVEYQRPYLVEKLSKLSSEPSGPPADRGVGEHVLLCEVLVRGIDPRTKAFRNRIVVSVYDDGDVRHRATDDPVDADVVQKIVDVLQRSYGTRKDMRKPRVGDCVEVKCEDYVEVLGRQEELNSGFFYAFVIVDDVRDDAFGGRDSSGGVWRRSTDGDGWRWSVGMPRLGDEVDVRLGNSDWTRRIVEEFRLRRASITPGDVELGVYDGIMLRWFSVSDRGKSWRPVTS